MRRRDIRQFGLCALLGLVVGVLAACQVTPTGGGAAFVNQQYAVGAERVQACIETRCSRMDLDGSLLRDYSQLQALPHITALMVSYTDFANLSDIAGMTQLTELHVGASGVTDLSAIADFPNLRVVHVQDLDVSDYSPLANLPNLRELAVGSYDLTDLSFVSGSPRLNRLLVTNAYALTDLSALAGHPGLTTLDLAISPDADLSPLLRMPALRTVSIAGFAEDVSPALLSQLRARGVTVSFDEPVVIVC